MFTTCTQHKLRTRCKVGTLYFLSSVHPVIAPKYMYVSIRFTCEEDGNWRHLIIIVNSGALQFTDSIGRHMQIVKLEAERTFHCSFSQNINVSALLNLVQQ
jgi:hypothetical protein